MKKIRTTITLILMALYGLQAQNPISPAGSNLADPSARVFSDGMLYLYCSVDSSVDTYCSSTNSILTTSDMMNWTVVRDVLESRGENDQVPYNEYPLYAPDCHYRNGKYYFYYSQPGEIAEGVATGTGPTGPFAYSNIMKLSGIQEIDPAVFIDDDGTAYYIWGQFTAKIARLNADMTSIDTTSIIEDLLTEEQHHFHDGSYMFKRKGVYYMVFADISRSNRPTCLGYATSDSPTGPFRYRGVIIDNDNCDPANWNNHGSVAEYGGQWYVFYHRTSHNTRSMRRACVEPIFFNEDGTIDEVEMTSQGAGPALNAFEEIEAERACLLFGNCRVQGKGPENEVIGGIRDADNIAFKYIDFGEGASGVQIRVKPLQYGGTIRVVADQPWKAPAATIEVAPGEGWEWITLSAETTKLQGKRTVWLTFEGCGEDMFSIDWIKFNK